MPKLLKYALLLPAALTLVFLLALNQGVASLAATFVSAAYVWTHLGLLAVEACALFWLWRGMFGRRRHLVFDAATPEERARLAKELARRLRGNAHLKAAGYASVNLEDPEGRDRCLAVLREKADAEIRRTAERIFLATALSQNGRIDAIIVFAALCRLVWRISGIYNQRPHPSEVLSLYWAVLTSTFLAFSFEELDIATEVGLGFGEAFHAMAPATMAGGLPIVGAALQKFTASAVDGAANCFLTLRAGIIARNAYAYSLQGKVRPGRAAVFKESGAVLLDMSGRLVEQISRGLGGAIWGLTKAAGNRTAQATARAGAGITHGVGAVASGVVSGVAGFAAPWTKKKNAGEGGSSSDGDD